MDEIDYETRHDDESMRMDSRNRRLPLVSDQMHLRPSIHDRIDDDMRDDGGEDDMD